MARFLVPLLLSITVGCGSTSELPAAEEADPIVEFPIVPPDVLTAWPCPPFAETESTEDRMNDDDIDGLTDCQEDIIGTNPDSADTDGDLVPDIEELGRLVRVSEDQPDQDIIDDLQDTDRDDILDILDEDDDGDGVPTAEELGLPDEMGNLPDSPLDAETDGDGDSNYLDEDDDNDFADIELEDMMGSGAACDNGGAGDGDPTNDDFDCDGIANWLDADDDNDTAAGCEDTSEFPDGIIQFDPIPDDGVNQSDDVDGDGILDPYDPDDDGDGVPTANEDWDGDGDPCNDDLDNDGLPDFADLDEDDDDVSTIREDVNGNGMAMDDDTDGDGIPNYRDIDDDNDGVPTVQELGLPDGDGNLPSNPRNVDTDGDGIPNYLDIDDDGDGCRTRDEHTRDTDGDPRNDVDGNITPDYLNADFSACLNDRSDATLTGTGFTTDNGARVYATLTSDQETAIVGRGEAVIAGDGFTIDFPVSVIADDTYVVDYFVDVVADGMCVAGDDTVYQLPVAAGIVDITTTAGLDTTPVCLP
ncbi:MAG: hypothetical protein AAF211_12635 [Myxococcota bacterium]